MELLATILYGDFLGKPGWMWLAFIGIVLGLLAFDLGILHRNQHEIEVKESLGLSAFYICIALIFGGWVWWHLGPESGINYLTGFMIEKSLAMDNVFVIALIFSYFAIPRLYQHRVLFWGILGVIVLRAIMIGLGAALVTQFSWILYVFGGFLVLTGIKMMFASDEPPDIANNPVLRFLRRHLRVTDRIEGHAFFVRMPDETGRLSRHATPLFLALVLVELADLVFAVDSVPAIFAITREPLIVFTSNIFAILGLRALYFLLAGAMDSFHLLRYGLGIVLIFVGAKMTVLNELFDGHFPIVWSLVIICGVIGASVVASLLFPKRAEVLDSSEGPGAPEMPEASDVPDASEDSHASGGHAARRS